MRPLVVMTAGVVMRVDGVGVGEMLDFEVTVLLFTSGVVFGVCFSLGFFAAGFDDCNVVVLGSCCEDIAALVGGTLLLAG